MLNIKRLPSRSFKILEPPSKMNVVATIIRQDGSFHRLKVPAKHSNPTSQSSGESFW